MKTKRMIAVIDTHSSGETTRVVIGGFPRIPGRTMWDKTKYCQAHYDAYRTSLMMQPRGFAGMLGAIITDPADAEADYGVIFLYSGGYFNSCGDSTFSVVKVLMELGMKETKEPATEVVLDTAAGLIKAQARIKSGVIGDISFCGPPSFHQETTVIDVQGIGRIHGDIAFGGLYYLFVSPEEAGIEVEPANAKELIKTGMHILGCANKQIKVKHPVNPDLNSIELVTFSAKPARVGHDYKHANVFGNTICVSPAGTSVSARLATLFAQKKLRLGEDVIVESLINGDLTMTGRATQEQQLDGYRAIIPQLSAKSYIVGTGQCIIEEDDPLEYGFALA